MGFRENLLAKIKINELSQSILQDIGAAQSGRRIDLDVMRQLIEMGTYRHRRERDLELYVIGGPGDRPDILVLDNELKIFNTSVADVALRKSPTIKEMVNIRNAIKILNDKDVVVSQKADSLERIREELIGTLDLSYGPNDIQDLVNDGLSAIQNNYTDGLVEVAMLFAELLHYHKAPKPYRANHYHIWGKLVMTAPDDIAFGPTILINLMHNELKIVKKAIHTADKTAMRYFNQIIRGESEADLKGKAALTYLQRLLIDNVE
jgi:hypothetical protein